MNLTDTYPGRPLRQVRTVALPVRKGTAADQNVRSWGIDDAREQGTTRSTTRCLTPSARSSVRRTCLSSARADAGPFSATLTAAGQEPSRFRTWPTRWASRERMRQIETVGLRKVEARSADADGYRRPNATPDGGGSGPGVERMIPWTGTASCAVARPPRDVINARCLEALREMTADGRYVTATAVAEAIGIGGARRRFRFTRWPGR